MKLSYETEQEIISLRRKLHQIPELGFKEHATSKLIVEYLQSNGIEVTSGVAGTGVVGLIRGGSDGKTLLLRADIDALPIEEAVRSEFKSKNPGVMHACGHDIHAAILLGTAKILSEIRGSFAGNIKLVFQPAEESDGGAEPMIAGGVMENPAIDGAVAYHVAPLPVGQIEVQPGAVTAAPDYFIIHIRGKGGHGSAPEDCVNPVIIAALVTKRLSEIKTETPSVVSVCSIVGGTCENVIPDSALIKGTVRSVDEETRQYLYNTVKNITEEESEKAGGKADIQYNFRYPAVINDEDFAKAFAASAAKVIGQENVVRVEKRSMVGDDFSYFSQLVPSCYARLGIGIGNMLHSSNFNPDERGIAIGIRVLCKFVLDYLNTTNAIGK
ncbi:MAG: amidohydrolase [Oscillospiraceae bacterium]|jgi:amidohydrolase|nr:amidohydrolase [Oscillospiraceae bacterium]